MMFISERDCIGRLFRELLINLARADMLDSANISSKTDVEAVKVGRTPCPLYFKVERPEIKNAII